MAIPKILHCCWLSGDPYPELVRKCMDSWRNFLPDYEIVVWNFEKIKEISSTWVNSAIETKKWAFAADYIRIYALYNYGGIYLDLDVEVLKTFDPLLNESFFLGRECARNVIEAAVLGSESKISWMKDCLNSYEGRTFDISKINLSDVAIPYILKQYVPKEALIYPCDFFSPKNNLTGQIRVTDNSYCIHHFGGSWFTLYQKRYFEVRRKYSKKYGPVIGFVFASFYALMHKMFGKN